MTQDQINPLQLTDFGGFVIAVLPILTAFVLSAFGLLFKWDKEMADAKAFDPAKHVEVKKLKEITSNNFEVLLRLVHTFNFYKYRKQLEQFQVIVFKLMIPIVIGIIATAIIARSGLVGGDHFYRVIGFVMGIFCIPGPIVLLCRLKRLENLARRIEGKVSNVIFRVEP